MDHLFGPDQRHSDRSRQRRYPEKRCRLNRGGGVEIVALGKYTILNTWKGSQQRQHAWIRFGSYRVVFFYIRKVPFANRFSGKEPEVRDGVCRLTVSGQCGRHGEIGQSLLHLLDGFSHFADAVSVDQVIRGVVGEPDLSRTVFPDQGL